MGISFEGNGLISPIGRVQPPLPNEARPGTTISHTKSKKNTEIHAIRNSQIDTRLGRPCMHVWRV
jgi:hypothetical protein